MLSWTSVTFNGACELDTCRETEGLRAVHFLAPNGTQRWRLCNGCYERLKELTESGLTAGHPNEVDERASVLAFSSRVHLELFLEALKSPGTSRRREWD